MSKNLISTDIERIFGRETPPELRARQDYEREIKLWLLLATDEQLLSEINRRRNRCVFTPAEGQR